MSDNDAQRPVEEDSTPAWTFSDEDHAAVTAVLEQYVTALGGGRFSIRRGVGDALAEMVAQITRKRVQELRDLAPAERLAEPLVSPLPAHSVGLSDLSPSSAGSPRLIGHPGDPVVGLDASSSGGSESAQGELPQIATMQGVDGDRCPVGGSGTADEVFDLGTNVHVPRVDDKTGECQEMMTPGPDAMSTRNPYAELARKWAAIAEVSRPDERAALSLMVADLWMTIDDDAP